MKIKFVLFVDRCYNFFHVKEIVYCVLYYEWSNIDESIMLLLNLIRVGAGVLIVLNWVHILKYSDVHIYSWQEVLCTCTWVHS